MDFRGIRKGAVWLGEQAHCHLHGIWMIRTVQIISAAWCIFHVVCTEIKIYGIGGHMYTACVTTYPVGMVTYTCT